MFLKRIELTNIHSIEHLDLSFDAAECGVRKWTFILGENGSGKSTLLRSIALVVAGSASLTELLLQPDNWIRLKQPDCAIEADLMTADGEERHVGLRWSRGQDIRAIFEQNKESMDLLDTALRYSTRNYFVIGYGATRRLAGNRSVSPSREPFSHPRARCVSTLFSNDAVLNPLDTWAMDLEYRKSKAGLAAVRRALADLLPGVSLTRIDREHRALIFATQDGELPLDQLSEGYQNMAAWCGDLLFRITETYKDYKHPLNARGLLLIDELDLHLHPVWQRVLKQFLDTKLPHFQIIGTTHSPLTAQQAGERELYFLDRDSASGAAQLTQYPGAPNKLLIHQLLLSPAFGLTSMDSKEVEDKKIKYRSLKAKKKRKKPLSPREKKHLTGLRDELSDLPDWSRGTAQDRHQTALLTKIEQELTDRPRDGARPGRA